MGVPGFRVFWRFRSFRIVRAFRVIRGVNACGFLLHKGQRHAEGSALPHFTLHVNLAVQRIHDLLRQGQPHAAAHAPRGVSLIERFEDVGQVFRFYAAPCVADAERELGG